MGGLGSADGRLCAELSRPRPTASPLPAAAPASSLYRRVKDLRLSPDRHGPSGRLRRFGQSVSRS
jgi:hypothetical protein